jgi:hypothetical protein
MIETADMAKGGRCRARRVAYHKHRLMLIFTRKNFTRFYPSFFMTLVFFAATLRFPAIVVFAFAEEKS